MLVNVLDGLAQVKNANAYPDSRSLILDAVHLLGPSRRVYSACSWRKE